MTLAGVYGFWKYVSKLERRETRRYLEMFYILKFRDLVSLYFNKLIAVMLISSHHLSSSCSFGLKVIVASARIDWVKIDRCLCAVLMNDQGVIV